MNLLDLPLDLIILSGTITKSAEYSKAFSIMPKFLSLTLNNPPIILDLEIFLKNTEFNYVHARVDLNFMYDFDITVYPTHWIVDETGIIRDLIVGTSLDIYDKLSSSIEKNKK